MIAPWINCSSCFILLLPCLYYKCCRSYKLNCLNFNFPKFLLARVIHVLTIPTEKCKYISADSVFFPKCFLLPFVCKNDARPRAQQPSCNVLQQDLYVKARERSWVLGGITKRPYHSWIEDLQICYYIRQLLCVCISVFTWMVFYYLLPTPYLTDRGHTSFNYLLF